MAVADIFIRIVTKGAELANKQMSNLGGTTKKLAGIVKGAGLAFASGLAVGITKATREFIEFEDALNQSLAIMNTTIAQQENMSRAAREVAVTTRISATESAESFFFLASAGLDAEQSIAALPQVSKFAQAGMFDMSLATDLATDAQSALGLTVQDAQQNLENLTRVTDVLVKANTLANASVQQFSEALTTKAGAALKVVNKDIEEGVAVLAAFADRGVKGAEAGDKLNQVLRDIPRATAKNSEEFAKLGLNMFDTEGNMKNVADIIEELDRVLGPMSDELKASTLDQLGLNRGVADAVKILSGAGDQIREYEEALRDAGGTTQEVADKQIDSLQGQLDILRSKFGEVGLAIIEKYEPAFQDAIDVTGVFLDLLLQRTPDIEDFAKSMDFLIKVVNILNPGFHTNKSMVDALAEAQENLKRKNIPALYKEMADGIRISNLETIDATRNSERYAMEQDMLEVALGKTTQAVEDQTDSVTELSQEMIDKQFNALMAMVDAEEAYNDIIEENEKLLTRRKERETDKAEAQAILTKATEKVSALEEELIKAREEAKKVTDEEKLAILRQEAAVQRLLDVEEKSELQKQELLVAEKRLNQLRKEAEGDDQNVLKVIRELEQARSEEQRAIDNLKDAQERLNDATKEYNDATADTPANILRMAEAKQKLDEAIADVDALEGFRGALLQIVEDTGVGLADIYKQLMDIKNLKTLGKVSGVPSIVSGDGAKKTNVSADDEFDADFKKSQEESLEKVLEKQATQKILEDPRFVGGASGVTTLINLKNEFNISGEINSEEVAIKAIEAQKRGLKVII
jgi:TP901 family phage tail tape measure protein